jgi:2-hydroxychromene-2-carboxylate isomerase
VPPSAEQPVFYYDLGSAECYLVAEQIMHVLEPAPAWQPVLAAELRGPRPMLNPSEVQAQARELGLQPMRWPEPGSDSESAMMAATYAKQIGRGVAFSLAAFRQAFAGGRDLGDMDTVLIAGAACEMHPGALMKALGRRAVAQALANATAQARKAGVRSVPAISASGQVFEGAGALEKAAQALADSTRAAQVSS